METLDAIKTRRSIREFLKKDVDDKLIHKIIEAGMRAPSSKNTQPWYFIILKGKKKDAVVNITEKKLSEQKVYRRREKIKSSALASCEIAKNAPILILVFNKAPYTGGKKNVIKNCNHELLQSWTIEVESVSAAIQNMLLAIHELGLGGVWLADFNFVGSKICKSLNCKYDLLAGIALGYPAYKLPPRKIPKTKIKILK